MTNINTLKHHFDAEVFILAKWEELSLLGRSQEVSIYSGTVGGTGCKRQVFVLVQWEEQATRGECFGKVGGTGHRR